MENHKLQSFFTNCNKILWFRLLPEHLVLICYTIMPKLYLPIPKIISMICWWYVALTRHWLAGMLKEVSPQWGRDVAVKASLQPTCLERPWAPLMLLLPLKVTIRFLWLKSQRTCFRCIWKIQTIFTMEKIFVWVLRKIFYVWKS